MSWKNLAAGAVGICMLTACTSVETASRQVPGPVSAIVASKNTAVVPAQLSSFRIVKTNVVVPAALRVSEANAIYPRADIVWRGDPVGDRHAQVGAVIEAAAKDALRGWKGKKPVVMNVTVLRFHCLTEKARALTGGVYSIAYALTLRDARTGAIVYGPHEVIADLPAWGSQRAFEEERQGLTQKMVITTHLSSVFKTELTRAQNGGRPLPL